MRCFWLRFMTTIPWGLRVFLGSQSHLVSRMDPDGSEFWLRRRDWKIPEVIPAFAGTAWRRTGYLVGWVMSSGSASCDHVTLFYSSHCAILRVAV